MRPQDLRIEDFTYSLPEERIAKHPLQERGNSKLLVYKNATIQEDAYVNLTRHLPAESLLVFNETRVIHARLLFQKDTGGMIEVFCLEPHEQYPDVQQAMAQKGKVWWKCMVGGASKWKHGLVLSTYFKEGPFTLRAEIVERLPGYFTVELSWDADELSFAEVLQVAGKVPLPPYLKREPEVSDKERYQTVYAKEDGSVAAPTAGLHFTGGLMQSLEEKKINKEFVTLHVGAGTFKPVKSTTMAEHEMHAEWIDVSVSAITNVLRHLEKNVVAVGTTSLRTLETLYWFGVKLIQHHSLDLTGISLKQWEPYELESSDISPEKALQALADWMLQNHNGRLVTRTQILIAPGYDFKIADGLITNFHQPQSTLLLLVAAFIGEDWRKVYDYAMSKDFRFLSYGDGSLLWRKSN